MRCFDGLEFTRTFSKIGRLKIREENFLSLKIRANSIDTKFADCFDRFSSITFEIAKIKSRVSIRFLYNLKKLLKSEMMRYRNEICFMLIFIS